MGSKLWIIGDSFTGANVDGKSAWVDIVTKKFKGKEHYVSSRGSRDFQTILDIFLRNLQNIKEEDFVILVMPTLVRTRLPLQTPMYDVEISNFINKQKTFDYFIGTHSYSEKMECYRLEEPLVKISESELNKQCGIWSIVNSSTASKNNYLQILKSLKEYLPFEMFIWSWENEIDSDLIVCKNQITETIGYWHTLSDLYKETNGENGKIDDVHFSPKMHKAFADYIIVNFPQFFNT
jgi:hypothetical protein